MCSQGDYHAFPPIHAPPPAFQDDAKAHFQKAIGDLRSWLDCFHWMGVKSGWLMEFKW